MRIGFLVNEIGEVEATQTTAMLIAAALRRGHVATVFGVADLEIDADDRIRARAVPLGPAPDTAALVAAIRGHGRERVDLDELDVFFIRTNPARDPRAWAHETALGLARMLRARGVTVVNDPDGLVRAGSKLYLSELPATVRPRTRITRDPAALEAFVEASGAPVILKPLVGTRGRDVFRIDPGERSNLRPIIDVLTRAGYAMAQEYLPEAPAGDMRVVVMGGALLEIDGRPAAVRRVPHPKDFRSNIHAGGHTEPAPAVTATVRAAVATIGPRLLRDGIFLAGLDFIGARVVEINVYSTGGFRDAERYTGVCFSDRVIEGIEGLRRG